VFWIRFCRRVRSRAGSRLLISSRHGPEGLRLLYRLKNIARGLSSFLSCLLLGNVNGGACLDRVSFFRNKKVSVKTKKMDIAKYKDI
jgi:hypothetical protein